MAKDKKLRVTLKATNIGPHESLNNTLNFSSLKVGVFANNGSGKTFLSRMFRLIENGSVEKVNKALSINSKSGDFSFQIDEKKDSGDTTETLKLQIKKDCEPTINNGTRYIYHVFNSDYVKENIEELKYQPDGNIEGYILGKTKIDLSKEKAESKKLDKEIKEKGGVFQEEVDKAKTELDEIKISKNTREYKFNYKEVYDNTLDYSDEETFETLKKLNSTLSKMPDDLSDISEINIKAQNDFVTSLTELLQKEYTKSSFAQDFKDKITSKQQFISDGIENLPKNNEDWKDCPFCEQELLVDAKKLIDKYVQFLDDEESKIKSQIKNLTSSLGQLEKDLNLDIANFSKIEKLFNKTKQYIPSETSTTLVEFTDDTAIKQAISNIKELLSEKAKNIEQTILLEKFENEIKIISTHLKDLNEIAQSNNILINRINEKKQNTSTEKLNLNRRLCKARYQQLQKDLKDSITEIKSLHNQKKELDKDIEIKESQEKVSKKSKIVESLKYYLNCFFGSKYTLDEENSCLKFHKHSLNDTATDVLSDGEKSIVAFCIYLSDLHKVVSKEADYENIFFIIDDPISSLDFHYVYSVAQVLRNLQEQLKIQRTRFLIFTHNLEFMSILIRNKIIKEQVILSNGELSPLSRELVMPYEEHLRDVNLVSKGGKLPSHTTPNSVRHVLETIYRFEAPNLDLKKYVEQQQVLSENQFIYSLMHDGSHGGIRQQ